MWESARVTERCRVEGAAGSLLRWQQVGAQRGAESVQQRRAGGSPAAGDLALPQQGQRVLKTGWRCEVGQVVLFVGNDRVSW
jgi:hypothetical protein